MTTEKSCCKGLFLLPTSPHFDCDLHHRPAEQYSTDPLALPGMQALTCVNSDDTIPSAGTNRCISPYNTDKKTVAQD